MYLPKQNELPPGWIESDEEITIKMFDYKLIYKYYFYNALYYNVNW